MARHSVAEIGAGAAVLVLAGGFLVYALGSTGTHSTPHYQLFARFNDVGGLAPGADVRMAGVKIGAVNDVHFDPKTYQAVVGFTVDRDVKLASDSSSQISTASLLGGVSLAVQEGGADDDLQDGQTMTITQSAANVEDLLSKFIYNVGDLASATQKQLKADQGHDQGAAKTGAAPASTSP